MNIKTFALVISLALAHSSLASAQTACNPLPPNCNGPQCAAVPGSVELIHHNSLTVTQIAAAPGYTEQQVVLETGKVVCFPCCDCGVAFSVENTGGSNCDFRITDGGSPPALIPVLPGATPTVVRLYNDCGTDFDTRTTRHVQVKCGSGNWTNQWAMSLYCDDPCAGSGD